MASILSVEQLQGLAAGSTPNTITIPTGQKLHAPGHVIQTQRYQAATSDITVSSQAFVASDMQVNITPKFSNSMILLRFCFSFWFSSDANGYCNTTIYRNSTNIGVGSYNSVAWFGPMRNSGYNNHATAEYTDLPNTTSAINYRVYFAPYTASPALRAQWAEIPSFLIAQEIAQ